MQQVFEGNTAVKQQVAERCTAAKQVAEGCTAAKQVAEGCTAARQVAEGCTAAGPSDRVQMQQVFEGNAAVRQQLVQLAGV